MDVFLLKSAACLAIFYTFYKVFLEKENLHRFKRFYLLGSLAISFGIPLITFTQYVTIPVPTTTEVVQTINPTNAIIAPETNYLAIAFWVIYGLGVLFFGFRFCRNLVSMIRKIVQNPQQFEHGIIHVLLRKFIIPHTFLNYVFLNKRAYEEHQIPQAVLDHEAAHAKQWHSVDILFVELLKVICWFNPLIHLFQKTIKLNHEFLADQAVLDKGISRQSYQEILLAYSSHAYAPSMAHAINYPSFKKRFTVMKKHTSTSSKLIKSLVVLPLLAILVYGFSSTQTVVNYQSNATKATAEQIAQYNTMAEFWNQRFAETAPERAIPLSELSTLETIYNVMSEDQRKSAQPFPVCSPPAKHISIEIDGYNISLNNKAISLAEFAYSLDMLTAKWNEDEMKNANLNIQIMKGKSEFMDKVEKEYQKTRLFKIKKNKLIPPPPPPPPAPEAPLSGKPNIKMAPGTPPPPPPAPSPDGITKPVMGVMLLNLPQVGPVPDLNDPEKLVEYMDEIGVPFYHEMNKITKEQALEIVRTHTLEITKVPHTDDGQTMMYFTKGC